MIPPKPQNLTSSKLGNRRKSFHWKFPSDEIDLTIEEKTIRILLGENLSGGGPTFYLDKPTSSLFIGFDPDDKYSFLKKWANGDSGDFKILSMFEDTSDFVNFVINEHQQLTNPGQMEFII
jgi:hypothetical protein